MGDAAKPCFFKRNKERGIIEDDFRRASPQPDYLIMDDSGNAHSSKTEKGLPLKKGTQGNYGNSPRKGPHAISSSPNVPKNMGHAQGARTNDSHKDSFKRWLSDELNETDNWLDFKTGSKTPVINRPRKDTFQEGEDGHRWQDGRGCRGVRWQHQKDLTNIEISEMQTGGSENKKPKKPRKSRRTRKEEHDQEEDMDGPVIDESVLSMKELLGLRQAEERLKRDCIDRLRKRSRNYPTAKYICKLCDVLVESIASAHKHIKEKRHKKNIKEKHEEQLLTTLPPPTPSQIKAIGVAIDKVVEEFGLNNEDLEQRLEIKQTMEKLFHQKLPDCSLRLYGSSYSRFGFKNSDLNIDVQFPATLYPTISILKKTQLLNIKHYTRLLLWLQRSMTQPDVLLLIQENLKNSESFIDIDADFHARVPVVVCREKQSGLICKVSAGNENACLTTNHLAALGKLEPKLVPLVIAFRYWAKLCCTDHPEEGGLPPYVFALMAIFFLQQRKEPVLPVYLGSWIEGFSLNKLANFNLKEVENDLVVWEQITSVRDDESSKETSFKRGKVPLVFDLENQCSAPVGQLWVELLRFYALEFNLGDLVISIRAKEAISREAKDWPKKRIAVEDPYSIKRNVARTLNSQLVYEYILHCLRATYKYFAIPHKKTAKTSPQKPPNINVDASQTSKYVEDDGKRDPEVQIINNKIMVMSDCIDAPSTVESFKTHQRNTGKVFDGFESPAEELGEVQVGINQGDLDCIIEEVIFDDSEDFKPHCEETESGNDEDEEEEEEEEEPDVRQDWEKNLATMDQELDDDSENGELLAHTNDLDMETDSISDLESFQNITITERDDFVTVHDKADMDEESTEGTDELEDSNKATHSVQGQTSGITNSDDEEEDEEEARHTINERDSITIQDELDTYTGYGNEDALSEEDGLVVPVKYEDLKEVRKNLDEPLLIELNEKHPLKEENVCEEGSTVDHSDLFYEFSKPVFTKGKPPTVVCSLCKREGHLKKDCPEDFKKIELDPLPPLTPRFSNILDQVCTQCYKDFSATALEDQAREHIRQNLESFIRQEFPGTKLSLFGSSKNGFGFKQSDLDICMTIDGLETSEGLDCIKMIEELSRVLRKHSGLRNVLPITTAKVPIVKFFHVRSGLEVDISLYNTLALHNTKLLAAYSSIDPRVKYLCYTMKVFTKMCDIGDASRGSLSSYAYTLMVLYFLQQRDPPVIPVLQEIYEEEKRPEIIVDGWNTYFFDRISELPAFWPEHGKNTESVGELWLGLLRFYTEEFDFKEHVICIRRKSLLTTFKKQWTSKYIVIEDPFDLNHNLGAGLSRKMTNFIMKAFINGRRVFGIPVKGFPKEYPSKMEYFFDPEVLTEGELAPNDRCCRICGKIGHFMKDCPMRRKVRRRHDHEDIKNQRYPENNEKRNKEDKEIQNKNTEREMLAKEGKLQCAPQKVKQGRGGVLEMGRDKVSRQSLEKWKRQDDKDLREKRCFICGREGHIKKDCPQYKGATGGSKSDGLFGSSSPGPLKQSGKLSQAIHLHEEKKKQKAKMFFSPQSGSLSNKYMTQGKASQKRTQQDL